MKTVFIQFYKDDGTEDKKYTKVLFYGVYKDALKLYSKMIDIDPTIAKLLEGKEAKDSDIKALMAFVEKEIGMFDDISKFFSDMFAGQFTPKEFEQHVPADDAISTFGQIIQLAKAGFQMGTT